MPIVIQLNRRTAGSDFSVPTKHSVVSSVSEGPCDAPLSPLTAPIMTAPQFVNGRRLPTSFFGSLADAECPSITNTKAGDDDGSSARFTHNPYGYGMRVIGQSFEEPAQNFSPAETRGTNTVIYALDVAAGMPAADYVPADSIKAATSSPMSFLSSKAERFFEECNANASPNGGEDIADTTIEPQAPQAVKVQVFPTPPTPVYPVRHCIFSVASAQDGSEEHDYKLLAQYTSLAPALEATGLIGHAAISGCTVYTYVSVQDEIKDIPSCHPPHWRSTPTAKLEAEDGTIAEIIASAPFQNQCQAPPSAFQLAATSNTAADLSEADLREARMVQRYSKCGGSSYLPANVRTRHIVTCLGANHRATAKIAYMDKHSVSVVPSGLTTVHANNHFSQSQKPIRSQVTSPAFMGDVGTDNETPIGRGTSPNGVSLANCTKLAYHEAKSQACREDSISPFQYSAPPTPTPAGTPSHAMSMFGTPTIVSAY